MNVTIPRTPPRSRRGMSATILLLTATPLLLVAGTLLSVVVNQQEEGHHAIGEETAGLIAYSGAQEALAMLNEDPEFRGTFQVPQNGGLAVVTVTHWETDGADNDGNGLIDDAAEEDFYDIQSIGWLNAQLDGNGDLVDRSVRAYRGQSDVVAHLIDVDLDFAQTIYIDDPAAVINLDGGAFVLSGNDVDPDGGNGSDPPRPAVGVNGDPSGIIAQVANNQRSKIIGSLPDPAIGQTTSLDPTIYADLIQPLADQSFAGGSSFSGTLGDYRNLDGQITYADGDLTIHGKSSGAGILFVDGDLTIKGTFDYAGVIFCTGDVIFSGGGGAKELNGSLVLWGQDGIGGPKDDLRISGTVQVEYSSKAVAMAELLAGVEVMFWRDR